MGKDRIRLCGSAMRIADEELGASVSMELLEEIYDEWKKVHEKTEMKAWLRSKLVELFPAVGDRPKWPKPFSPRWPYKEGRPMVFLGQLRVPPYHLPSGHKFSEHSLVFVFGTPDGPPSGYKMVFEVLNSLERL